MISTQLYVHTEIFNLKLVLLFQSTSMSKIKDVVRRQCGKLQRMDLMTIVLNVHNTCFSTCVSAFLYALSDNKCCPLEPEYTNFDKNDVLVLPSLLDSDTCFLMYYAIHSLGDAFIAS
jgi:hypothetical protein